jgi:hypothetical protein
VKKTNMTKSFTEELITGFLKDAGAGMPVKELRTTHGFSDASFYTRREVRRQRCAGSVPAKGQQDGELAAEETAALSNWRRLERLSIVDDFNKEAGDITVYDDISACTSREHWTGQHVCGYPKALRSD